MTTATLERAALMHPQLVNDIHQLLGAAGIVRTDTEVDHAIQATVESEAEQQGTFQEAGSLASDPQTWDYVLRREGGILDRLEIDSEDKLYDRVEREAVAHESYDYEVRPDPRSIDTFAKWAGLGW